MQELNGTQEEEKQDVPLGFAQSPWNGDREWGQAASGDMFQIQGMRLGVWVFRNGGKSEDLKLAYLVYWLEQSVGFQEVPVGVKGYDKAMCREKGI